MDSEKVILLLGAPRKEQEMPRPWILHRNCDHENTPYKRWKCRAKVRHAECNHRQDPTGWKACERIEPVAK